MLRKVMLIVVMAAAGILMNAANALSAESASGRIVFRCHTTMSVSLVAGNASYDFGDIAAAATVLSTQPVIFRNDSSGLICSWELNIDAGTLDGWTLSNVQGIDQFALSGLFRKTQPTVDMFDVNNDTFSVTVKRYNAVNFHDAGYDTDGFKNQAGNIYPYGNSDIRANRSLWLKMASPLAVSDQNQRTIYLIVTAVPILQD